MTAASAGTRFVSPDPTSYYSTLRPWIEAVLAQQYQTAGMDFNNLSPDVQADILAQARQLQTEQPYLDADDDTGLGQRFLDSTQQQQPTSLPPVVSQSSPAPQTPEERALTAMGRSSLEEVQAEGEMDRFNDYVSVFQQQGAPVDAPLPPEIANDPGQVEAARQEEIENPYNQYTDPNYDRLMNSAGSELRPGEREVGSNAIVYDEGNLSSSDAQIQQQIELQRRLRESQRGLNDEDADDVANNPQSAASQAFREWYQEQFGGGPSQQEWESMSPADRRAQYFQSEPQRRAARAQRQQQYSDDFNRLAAQNAQGPPPGQGNPAALPPGVVPPVNSPLGGAPLEPQVTSQGAVGGVSHTGHPGSTSNRLAEGEEYSPLNFDTETIPFNDEFDSYTAGSGTSGTSAGGTGAGGGTVPTTGGSRLAEDAIREFQEQDAAARAANERRYGEALEGYRARERFGLEQLQGLGEQTRFDINRQHDRLGADLRQDLQSRGLQNTTIQASVGRGVAEDRQRALARLDQDLARERIDVGTGLSGDTLGFIERRDDVQPDQGALLATVEALGASGYSDSQGATPTQQTQPAVGTYGYVPPESRTAGTPQPTAQPAPQPAQITPPVAPGTYDGTTPISQRFDPGIIDAGRTGGAVQQPMSERDRLHAAAGVGQPPPPNPEPWYGGPPVGGTGMGGTGIGTPGYTGNDGILPPNYIGPPVGGTSGVPLTGAPPGGPQGVNISGSQYPPPLTSQATTTLSASHGRLLHH